jgi:hypothetical protein
MNDHNTHPPTIGLIVHYRGKVGAMAIQPAMIVTTTDTLEPGPVEAGDIPDLDTDMHVHLRVLTASEAGGYTEYNVPHVSDVAEPDLHPRWPEGPGAGTWAWRDLNRKPGGGR